MTVIGCEDWLIIVACMTVPLVALNTVIPNCPGKNVKFLSEGFITSFGI